MLKIHFLRISDGSPFRNLIAITTASATGTAMAMVEVVVMAMAMAVPRDLGKGFCWPRILAKGLSQGSCRRNLGQRF